MSKTILVISLIILKLCRAEDYREVRLQESGSVEIGEMSAITLQSNQICSIIANDVKIMGKSLLLITKDK